MDLIIHRMFFFRDEQTLVSVITNQKTTKILILLLMHSNMEFFTPTFLNWQDLLSKENHMEIVLSSLKFLVEEERIWLYGYVLMPNHLHILWRRQDF